MIAPTAAFRSAATASTVERAPGTEASRASSLRHPDTCVSHSIDATVMMKTPTASVARLSG